jgi:CheY-like chemotaxis protein
MSESKQLENTQILLVEDDPFLIDIYTKEFERFGYQIGVVTRGNEVLDYLKNHKVSLILLDILLPGISGWQILEEIKKDENTKDIKIIILSNISSKEDIEKAFSLGAEKYLVKAHYLPKEVVEESLKLLNK